MTRQQATAASAFALGLATGLFLRNGAHQMAELMRAARAHRDYERTNRYGHNLPESLGRREPEPESQPPRFGGTGALGMHPEAGGARRG